ncbi:MAG: hypothetical protein K9H64_21795 [Bacteroidales bacterium]|nr:hypothetical protein [Bacteroidales bacterium]MCF8458625.1 hypothetical protein [Bacteroidales bacterium]
MKHITLTAEVLEQPGKGYTAWLREIKGVIAYGNSIANVRDELMKMLRIKLEVDRDANNEKCTGNRHIETLDLTFA